MWPLVVLLLTEGSLATPDTDTVEHRVTWQEAVKVLQRLNLTQLEGEGCRPCTDRQKGYCLSQDLIQDHCTCDHRLSERLPYVDHTCYIPSRVHPTFAPDCSAYLRYLECCCHAALFPLMKKRMLNASNTLHFSYLSLLLPLLPSRWS